MVSGSAKSRSIGWPHSHAARVEPEVLPAAPDEHETPPEGD